MSLLTEGAGQIRDVGDAGLLIWNEDSRRQSESDTSDSLRAPLRLVKGLLKSQRASHVCGVRNTNQTQPRQYQITTVLPRLWRSAIRDPSWTNQTQPRQ
jgi:hypothetical protein